MQADGRVIDYQHPPGITTSEGQAYSLFFALLANDPLRFSSLLAWTEEHLAEGNLSRQLPAWQWGQNPEGEWAVLDRRTASDADLWLAYTLLQAGRLWSQAEYTRLGDALLKLIEAQEIEKLPGLGFMLLPGNEGFRLGDRRWLLNPSYNPVQLLRALQLIQPDGPWKEIAENTLRMMQGTQKQRLAADWVVYDADAGWGFDEHKGPFGSYDAIRVYLWAGMLDDNEPLKAPLLATLGGMAGLAASTRRPLPERVNVLSGKTYGRAPAGFSAALPPFLASLDSKLGLREQQQRIRRKSSGELVGEHQHYYDQVLALFGQAWIVGRYRFDRQGNLVTDWSNACEKF